MSRDDDWEDDEEIPHEDPRNIEIQKMFAAIEKKAKAHINYMLLEGFIEPTSERGVYKYTPEGLVLAHQQYKSLKQQGLI